VFSAYTFENEEILPEVSDSCSGVQLRGKYFQYTAGVNSCGAKVSQGFDPERDVAFLGSPAPSNFILQNREEF